MTVISSAINDEDELERANKDKRKQYLDQSQGKGSGPQSLLHGSPADNPGSASLPVPGKR